MVKNIIIVCDSARVLGGIENVAFTSAVGLKKSGFNVIMFAAMGPIDNYLISNGIQVYCLNQIDILSNKNKVKALIQGCFNIKAYNQLNNLLKSYNPKNTIVHIHCWSKALSACVFLSAKKRKFKIVITAHDFFSICPNGALFNFKKTSHCSLCPMGIKCLLSNCDSRNYSHKLYRFIRTWLQYKFMFNNYFFVITISKITKDLLSPLLEYRTSKIYNLINPVILNDNKCIDITHNNCYIFIGRLSREKGCSLFCEAITQLGLKGVVLGDGYQLDYLKTRYPNIQFVGWVNGVEKEKYVCQAKALVATYLWNETFGLTIPEMKSYGIPCIVPDKGGPAEQITDGIDGYHYSFGDIESLKKVILDFEKCNLNELQQNLVNHFNKDRYTIANHVKNLIGIYNDIINYEIQNTNGM